jgi:hypothetical protein
MNIGVIIGIVVGVVLVTALTIFLVLRRTNRYTAYTDKTINETRVLWTPETCGKNPKETLDSREYCRVEGVSADEAKRYCTKNPECIGFYYMLREVNDGNYTLKTKTALLARKGSSSTYTLRDVVPEERGYSVFYGDDRVFKK